MARKRKYGKLYDKKLGLMRGLEEAVLVAVIVIALFTLVIGISRVSGNSMSPTLHDGQPVLYVRLEKNYVPGDIASVRMPDDEYLVKRIVAVEGDSVDIHDGVVYINGTALEDGFGYTEAGSFNKYPVTLPEGHIFVLGDNREISVDSRAFGPISATQTRGRIVLY